MDTTRYRIEHDTWTVLPHTGFAVLQATGTSVLATWTGDDLVIDTDGPIRIRDAAISGPWTAGRVYATPIPAA